jgi:hypothetical protein
VQLEPFAALEIDTRDPFPCSNTLVVENDLSNPLHEHDNDGDFFVSAFSGVSTLVETFLLVVLADVDCFFAMHRISPPFL